MRIHLVTPKNPPSFWTYDSILPTLGRRAIFPNLSMPTLAGLTPPHHDVTLCDENVEEIDFDVEADIVGVTGYIVHRERMLEIVDAFRARGRMVVVGGPFASLCPEALRGRADVVFIDEAEQTWPHFLEDLERGQWKSEYRADEKPDLALAPTPRFDLLKIERYHAITIQFARGCPFQCEFCDIIVLYGRKPRTKRPAQVMREIAECHRLGAKQVFIVDDNFIGDRKLAKALLREMAAWGEQHGWPMDFQTEVSLNVAQDEELLPLLRAARFTTLFIRIETPRKESPAATKKMHNMRGDLISVHRIQAHGIQVQAGMIVGFDADDESISTATGVSRASASSGGDGRNAATAATALHARLAAGRLVADSLGDQFVFSNIVPKRMVASRCIGLSAAAARALRTSELPATRWRSSSGRATSARRAIFVRAILALRARVARYAAARRSAAQLVHLSLFAGVLLRRPSRFRTRCRSRSCIARSSTTCRRWRRISIHRKPNCRVATPKQAAA